MSTEPKDGLETRSKTAVRWLVIAILLIMLLIVARHVQSDEAVAPSLETTSAR